MIFEVVWIETIVYDQSIVEENIRETKLTSPDYVGVTAEAATADFIARIAKYQAHYQTLPEDSEHPYVKIIDAGRQMKTNRIVGYLMGKIVFFLMNLRINRAPIYITRHGESMHNLKGLIGGDSELSPQGRHYAAELSKFIHNEPEFKNDNMKNLAVWTSTMVRTRETASYLNLPFTQWRALVELHVGACDNMTYEEIEQRFPAEWEARKRDKLRYRYPQGESYLDVIQRLEPCILELERMQTPVLLIVHRAVARCFLAYFLDIESKEIPYLDAPLHSVIKLVPKAYSCEKSQFKFAIPSVEDEGKETST
jgi:broad specificity phosphatase PhoE